MGNWKGRYLQYGTDRHDGDTDQEALPPAEPFT